MHESGLLESRREGLWNFYRLARSGSGNRFAESISWLIENEPEVEEDRIRVAKVLAERNLETRKFFDEIAEDWERLQSDVFGDFNLDSELAELLWIVATLVLTLVAETVPCWKACFLNVKPSSAWTVLPRCWNWRKNVWATTLT